MIIWRPSFRDESEHERRFTFMLAPLLCGIGAAFLASPVIGPLMGEEWALPLTGAAAIAGGSVGLRHNDWRAPDGHNGWGRVAALWLGFALLLPGALVWDLRQGPLDGGFVPVAAGWVILSALPFGRWEMMNARQCMGFAGRFYGFWLAVMLATAPMSVDYAGVVVALGYLASPTLAALIRKRLMAASTAWRERGEG